MTGFMRNTFARFLIAATLTLSLPVSALGAIRIDVEDTVAGLGATAFAPDLPTGADAQAVFGIPGGGERTVRVERGADGVARADLAASDSTKAGSYTVELRAGASVLGAASFTVVPDSVDAAMSDVRIDRSVIDTDGADAATVTVTLRDRYGNALTGRPVTLVASRKSDQVEPVEPQTDASGSQRFYVYTDMPGHLSLRAIDLLSGVVLESTAEIDAGNPRAVGGTYDYYAPQAPVYAPYPSPYASYAPPADTRTFYTDGRRAPSYGNFLGQVTGTFDVVDHFEVTAPAELPIDEEAPKITLRAVDRQGRSVENYLGTAVFTSTDPDAILPNFGEYTFKERDLGQKEFPLVLRFKTPGAQTVRIEDKTDPSIRGEATINVASGGDSGAAGTIVITSHKDGDVVSTTDITIKGTGPEYTNLTVMGGTRDVQSDTDGIGNFEAVIQLAPDQQDFTIRVRDDQGKFDSGPLHLVLDKNPPEVGAITFDPSEPEEGENVLVRVETDPDLPKVVFLLDDATADRPTATLTANPDDARIYQAFFPAPGPGEHQVSIIASDASGNPREVRAVLVVKTRGLPVVAGLTAQARTNAVALQWDPVPEQVTGYRVYVGEQEGTFDYSLDTGRPVTKATVAGLRPGTTYYFAVTALRDTMESMEKSQVLNVQTPGLTLRIREGDTAMRLEWEFPDDIELSGFLLQYHVDGDEDVQEERLLEGSARTYTLRDLFNGYAYVVRLTPISVTGDRLDELSAEVTGTPNGPANGFRAGPSDPAPFNLAAAVLPRVPEHSQEGLPSIIVIGVIGAATMAVLYRSRRKVYSQRPR